MSSTKWDLRGTVASMRNATAWMTMHRRHRRIGESLDRLDDDGPDRTRHADHRSPWAVPAQSVDTYAAAPTSRLSSTSETRSTSCDCDIGPSPCPCSETSTAAGLRSDGSPFHRDFIDASLDPGGLRRLRCDGEYGIGAISFALRQPGLDGPRMLAEFRQRVAGEFPYRRIRRIGGRRLVTGE